MFSFISEGITQVCIIFSGNFVYFRVFSYDGFRIRVDRIKEAGHWRRYAYEFSGSPLQSDLMQTLYPFTIKTYAR